MQGEVREIAVDLVGAGDRKVPTLVNSNVKRDPDGNIVLIRTAVFLAADRRQYERELLPARRRAEESEGRARLLAETLQSTFIPPRPRRSKASTSARSIDLPGPAWRSAATSTTFSRPDGTDGP
jgi:hypothetical protein